MTEWNTLENRAEIRLTPRERLRALFTGRVGFVARVRVHIPDQQGEPFFIDDPSLTIDFGYPDPPEPFL